MEASSPSGQRSPSIEKADAEPRRELLETAVAGDRTALERLLLDEFGMVQRHIERLLPNWLRSAASVEDVLQDTLTQAFRDIAQFEIRSEHSLRAWLCTVADHRMHDLIRRLRRKKRGGGRKPARLPIPADHSSLVELAALLSDRGDSPSQLAARDEIVQAIQVGLSSLPEDQREAVRRHFVERQDYVDAAHAMGRSPEAVRSLVYRAKQSLRDFMGRSSRWIFK